MLAGLNPSTEVTGGPWFSETELDVEFIDELCRVILRFLSSRTLSMDAEKLSIIDQRHYPTLAQIHEFIGSSGITSIDLSYEDVRMLLNRLLFDGEIEKIATVQNYAVEDDLDEESDIFAYRAIRNESCGSALASIPCGSCPVN